MIGHRSGPSPDSTCRTTRHSRGCGTSATRSRSMPTAEQRRAPRPPSWWSTRSPRLSPLRACASNPGVMTYPPPPHADFAAAYSRAWTSQPVQLLAFFAPDGSYTDVAMGATYHGREEIARFHRWMLKFAPDSVIEFSDACAAEGLLSLECVWSGTFEGALRLPDGSSVDATGAEFGVPGVAACRYTADGKPLRHRDYWDRGTVLRQVDVRVRG